MLLTTTTVFIYLSVIYTPPLYLYYVQGIYLGSLMFHMLLINKAPSNLEMKLKKIPFILQSSCRMDCIPVAFLRIYIVPFSLPIILSHSHYAFSFCFWAVYCSILLFSFRITIVRSQIPLSHGRLCEWYPLPQAIKPVLNFEFSRVLLLFHLIFYYLLIW